MNEIRAGGSMLVLFHRVAAGTAAVVMAAGLSACVPARHTGNDPQPAATGPVSSPVSPPLPQTTEPAPGDGSLPDVCQILTAQDVGAVLQTDITTAKPSTEQGENTCDYDNSAGTHGVSVGISATTASDFDSDAQGYPQVSDVGDAAFDDAVLLYVRDGDLKISVNAGGGDTTRIALARKLIDKLAAITQTPSEIPSS
jgi:hypothetical protein